MDQLSQATVRWSITTILGSRQCGKTTLTRMFEHGKNVLYFDPESVPDQQRLQNPELLLGSYDNLVVVGQAGNEMSCLT